MSIPAGFADGTPGTRAVSPNGSGGLDATFKTTDEIRVYNVTKDADAQDNGYNAKLLHPDVDGATAKLEGELTFYGYPNYVTVEVGDVLLLMEAGGSLFQFPAPAAGPVLKLCAAEGDAVEAGQVLVILKEKEGSANA